MEDNQTTPQTNTTFADVKLPNTNDTIPVSVGAVVSPQPVVSEPIVQTPVYTPPVSVPIRVDEPKPSNEQPSAPTNTPMPPGPASKGGGGHMLAIVVAIIIFLALAGAVVYVYMQSNTSKITRKESNTTTSNSVAPATTQDVDETTKAIDDNLANIDADKDFTTGDLSDATLGL